MRVKSLKIVKIESIWQLLSLQDARECLTRMVLALDQVGMKKVEIAHVLKLAEYGVPDRTIRRWVQRYRRERVVMSPNKLSGRPGLLSAAQERLSVGFVLHSISARRPVFRETVCHFVEEDFGISMSLNTAGSLLRDNGFSSKLTRKNSGGYKLDYETLAEIYQDFLLKLRKKNFFARDRSLVCSIDFTYTRLQQHRVKSYALRGGCAHLLLLQLPYLHVCSPVHNHWTLRDGQPIQTAY